MRRPAFLGFLRGSGALDAAALRCACVRRSARPLRLFFWFFRPPSFRQAFQCYPSKVILSFVSFHISIQLYYTMIVIAQQGAYFVNKWGRAVKRPFADKAAAVQCIAKHAKSLPVEGGGCECNEQTEGVNRGSAVYGNPSVNTPCGVLPAPSQAVAPLGSRI